MVAKGCCTQLLLAGFRSWVSTGTVLTASSAITAASGLSKASSVSRASATSYKIHPSAALVYLEHSRRALEKRDSHMVRADMSHVGSFRIDGCLQNSNEQ